MQLRYSKKKRRKEGNLSNTPHLNSTNKTQNEWDIHVPSLENWDSGRSFIVHQLSPHTQVSYSHIMYMYSTYVGKIARC